MFKKSAMWRHKNEGDERRSGEETFKKEMDNPLFLWRHMADLLDTLSHYLTNYKYLHIGFKIQ